VRQYERLFAMEGQKLVFSRESLREVVKLAQRRKTGARALRGIVEQSLMESMYELPGREDVEEVLVTPATIRGERRPRLQLRGATALPAPQVLPEDADAPREERRRA
jgi:ATP-dependent Clp protease ATP-binding subunit ClpX